MSSCEKCVMPDGDPNRYHELLLDRCGEKACTPEERAGNRAGWCPDCGRMTLHQHTGECMTPNCEGK